MFIHDFEECAVSFFREEKQKVSEVARTETGKVAAEIRVLLI
jgi:hypothetical protein